MPLLGFSGAFPRKNVMRVLVVDAYGASAKGRAAWKSFLRLVVAACDKQNIHVDMVTARYNGLADYIYQPDSRFVDPLSVTRFDRLDLVFVGGSPTHLPWAPRVAQVLILCRMCFQTNKCLFATTFAAHMVAYLCSTGGEPGTRVINGGGKGSPRSELPHFVVPPTILKKDLFFDNETGDLFQYESVESRAGKITSGAGSGGEWIPYCHSGLRKRAKFLLSLPRKYKPKEPAGKAATHTLAPGTIFEAVLTVRNRYIQHWAFKGVSGRQFKVSRYNAMDIDEKTSGSAKQAFQVCADSGDGLVPEVIESGNLFGTQFECSLKYPDTAKLLDNFVAEKYRQMNRHAYLDRSSRFMLMTASKATPGMAGGAHFGGGQPKDHREINPSPLLARLRRRKVELEAERERLEAETAHQQQKDNAAIARALRSTAPTGSNPSTNRASTPGQNTKEARQRPQSAHNPRTKSFKARGAKTLGSSGSGSKSKHIDDPRTQKPAPPTDRGHMARPATALPFRARVLPRPPLPVGAVSARRSSRLHDQDPAAHGSGALPDPGQGSRHYGSGSVRFASDLSTEYQLEDPVGAQKSGAATAEPSTDTMRWQNRRVMVNSVRRCTPKKHKPWSAWERKYKELTSHDKAFSARPVSIGIAASGPYISAYKHERLDYMRSKQKWVSKQQFRRHFGKASTAIGMASGGIVGSGKYMNPSNTFRDADDRSRFMNPIRGWRKF